MIERWTDRKIAYDFHFDRLAQPHHMPIFLSAIILSANVAAHSRHAASYRRVNIHSLDLHRFAIGASKSNAVKIICNLLAPDVARP